LREIVGFEGRSSRAPVSAGPGMSESGSRVLSRI